MYYNDYEDYMRGVLGYSNVPDNAYGNGCNCGMDYNMNYGNYQMNPMNSMSDMNQMNMFNPNNQMNFSQNRNNWASNIEEMYPEIYNIINPEVCKRCDGNNQPITEGMIEQMTNEIYDNVVNRVEIQNVINLNIGTRSADSEKLECNSGVENRGNCKVCNNADVKNRSVVTNTSNNNNGQNEKNDEKRVYIPQGHSNNRLLRDLIRILIINRLLSNRPPYMPGPGPRPPRPPRPMPRMDNGYMPYM